MFITLLLHIRFKTWIIQNVVDSPRIANAFDALDHTEITKSAYAPLNPTQFHFPPAYLENKVIGVPNEPHKAKGANQLNAAMAQRKYNQFRWVVQSIPPVRESKLRIVTGKQIGRAHV